MTRLLPFLSSLVLSASPVLAGPFGFDTSSKRNPADVYSYCKEDSANFFNIKCTFAPKPHPDMKFYRIGFVEGIGVCGIKGYGKFISDNRRGKLTKSKTDEIVNQVKSKYGTWTKKIDRISPKSTMQPDDWIYSLTKYRTYAYVWGFKNHFNGIKYILVSAGAIDLTTAYVHVEFQTPLHDKCSKARAPANSF